MSLRESETRLDDFRRILNKKVLIMSKIVLKSHNSAWVVLKQIRNIPRNYRNGTNLKIPRDYTEGKSSSDMSLATTETYDASIAFINVLKLKRVLLPRFHHLRVEGQSRYQKWVQRTTKSLKRYPCWVYQYPQVTDPLLSSSQNTAILKLVANSYQK